MVIFMGLLNDLFPGVDPPRKRDLAFEEVRPLRVLQTLRLLCVCLSPLTPL